jgi:gamma-glutamyltranspeptidase/glutathione hydrolase
MGEKPTGAIAAGHPETARAGAEILRAGGNAYDALVAALAVSFVSEPVLSSPGGGGFLLAHPVDEGPFVLDFFAQTPRRRAREAPLDFHPVHADFGTATQEFHVGRASIAAPGMLPGLFAIHRDLCTLPLGRLLEPAIALARNGLALSAFQAGILDIVAPIMLLTAGSRATFAGPAAPPRPLAAGALLRMPELAAMLEALGREGESLYRHGALGRALAALCADGGLLSPADIADFSVIRRPPLVLDTPGGRILTNPPPSSGGALIAFTLALMEGKASPLRRARALGFSGRARDALDLTQGTTGERVKALLGDPMLAEWRERMPDRAMKRGGTTHVSVIDGAGNAAACTVSNGEGCGHMVPGWGFMPNNMLGEEDLNPTGFFKWRPDSRVTSMMAPTLAERPDGTMVALGSGGSNRIRSALSLVLADLLIDDRPLAEAIAAPRLHVEGKRLEIEAGWDAAAVATLATAFPDHRPWPEPSMFFGGVHACARDGGTGALEAVGDFRRDGCGIIV